MEALEADPTAFRSLGGIATHDYNMGNTDAVETYVAKAGKPYWITEAGGDGAQDLANDPIPAASAASRYLSDVNHLVTHWVWFLGGENVSESIDQPDSLAGGSRLIQYKSQPVAHWYRKTRVYDALGDLSRTFVPGAVFRKSHSSLDGDMGWTYGHKPHIVAAVARNADGTWGIGLSNYTAADFPAGDQFHKDNAGYAAHVYAVTVSVPELAGVHMAHFTVHRSGGSADVHTAQSALMHKGLVTLNVAPLELVTLRSMGSR